MSIFITRPEPQETPIPAVRTDAAKRALLSAAVLAMLQPVADTKAAVAARVADAEASGQPASLDTIIDVFGMAVTLKEQIEASTLALAHGDYDGTDITECISEILASA